MNKNCKDFDGRYTCKYFNSDGTCNHKDRVICHIFNETGKQPVEDDVPLYVGQVLEAFPGAKVVHTNAQATIEEIYGKI